MAASDRHQRGRYSHLDASRTPTGAVHTITELQRHGLDVEGLLANPNVRKFVDWVANKDPDFTASTARKQR